MRRLSVFLLVALMGVTVSTPVFAVEPNAAYCENYPTQHTDYKPFFIDQTFDYTDDSLKEIHCIYPTTEYLTLLDHQEKVFLIISFALIMFMTLLFFKQWLG